MTEETCPLCGRPIDNFAPALSVRLVRVDGIERLAHNVCPVERPTTV